jgi:glycosyltransferase involved in cell wall biosynthesis
MRILIASQDWDYRFARPQHFARIFSRQHQVIYLATGPGILGRTRDVLSRRAPLRLLTFRINSRLQVFNALHPIDHGSPAQVSRDCRLNSGISRTFFPRAFRRADIVIVTNPLHHDVLRHLRWDKLVYERLDRYEDFFPVGSELRAFVREREQRLLREADFVFASARALVEEKAGVRKIHYLPHGVEIEHFQRPAPGVPEDMKEFKRPVVGFVGGIEPWVNMSWIEAAARRFPAASFVLIGDIRVRIDELARLPNVHFLGYRAYDQVPRYVTTFNVCIIPFEINQLTAAVNPIKVLEYLALGKPVVSSYMPELEALLPHIVMTHSAEGFVAAIERALVSDDAGAIHPRQEFARARSWECIVRQFLDVVTGRQRTTTF